MIALSRLPDQLQAGDSYVITLVRSDYPASAGWSLRWVLSGASHTQLESQASGDAHVFTLDTEKTGGLTAGPYRTSLRAENGPARLTIEVRPLRVLADLSTFAPGEGLSHARRMLALCQEARANILRGELKSYMINGRQTMLHTLDEVAREEARWRVEVAREESPKKAGGRYLPVTFVRR